MMEYCSPNIKHQSSRFSGIKAGQAAIQAAAGALKIHLENLETTSLSRRLKSDDCNFSMTELRRKNHASAEIQI